MAACDQSLPLASTGLGLMRMTLGRPSPIDDSALFNALKASITPGKVMHWNSATFYGPPTDHLANLYLVKRFFQQHPDVAPSVQLSVKGAVDLAKLKPTNSAGSIKASIDSALEALGGTKKIDIFECARVDRSVPIEDSIRTIAEYVKAGKVGGIGLSEASATSIRAAAAVHKIAGVEVEVSIFTQEIFEPNGVAYTCKELEIPIFAYSPLGMGLLTGNYSGLKTAPEDDYRKNFDRFKEGNLEQNLKIVNRLIRLAKEANATPAQLAIQWVRNEGKRRGINIIPIPGASSSERVQENLREIDLTKEQEDELQRIGKEAEVAGGRYNEHARADLMV